MRQIYDQKKGQLGQSSIAVAKQGQVRSRLISCWRIGAIEKISDSSKSQSTEERLIFKLCN